MGHHLINGEFQSDKYPTTPRGKVPLSCKDAMAQDLLFAYAQRRREVDPEFSADLEEALRLAGFAPRDPTAGRLTGTKPLILYFQTDEDREELIAAIREATPGMVAFPVK